MDDDFRKMLMGGLHLFQNKAQTYGINKKLTGAELALLGLQAWQHVDQHTNSHQYHPDGAVFEPLLSADFQTAAQKMAERVQWAPREQLNELCERFIAYAATVQEPGKRQQAMRLCVIMGMASGGGQDTFAGQQQSAARYAPEPEPRVVYREAPKPLPPPPHPDAVLFSQYFKPEPELDTRTAMRKIRADVANYDRPTLLKFVQKFLDYAATLRDSGELKRAFGLNSELATLLRNKSQTALPAPERRA